MRKIFNIIVGIAFISVLVWFGYVAWRTYNPSPDAITGATPDVKEYLLIKSTGQRVYSDEIVLLNPDAEVGSRVYELHSYYELVGKKYELRGFSINISEALFGEVIREKT